MSETLPADLSADRSAPLEAWKVHPKAGYIYRIEDRKVVYQHREVLLAHIGPGTHPCRHCATPVTWTRANNHTAGSWDGILVVDHIDHDRGNNDPSNLAPSCQSCNMKRRLAYVRNAKKGRTQEAAPESDPSPT